MNSNFNKSGEESLDKSSIIAHQMKTPISAADAILKTLLGEYAGALTPMQKDLLERADKRLSEALETSNRLTQIAGQNKAFTESCNALININIILHKIHASYIETAAFNGVNLHINLPNEHKFAEGKESEFIEILNSLINNALKYTPTGGDVSISCKENKGKTYISVSDSGIGIPEEEYDKIFHPYYRSEHAEKTTIQGSGIGLSLVKDLATRLNGTIKVSKSIYGGAEFILELNSITADSKFLNGDKKDILKVVIIGGVAAGPKVASKIIRLAPNTEVTIIEKGDLLSYSGCGLPYYISGVVKKQSELLSTAVKEVRDPVFFHNIKNVKVLNRTEALQIDRKNKKVKIKNLTNSHESYIEYDKLVLAAGADPIIPRIKGIEKTEGIYTLHGVKDAEGIKHAVNEKKIKDVTIIGGGLIAIEITEALVSKGCRVTILEKDANILNILDSELAMLIEKHLDANGVKIITDSKIHKIHSSKRAKSIKNDENLHDINKKIYIITERETIQSDIVIIAAGVKPNVTLALSSNLKIGKTGAIKVNKKMQTSDPNIYAAGDCAEKLSLITNEPFYIPLGSTANKEGRTAAINICGGNEKFEGITGSIVCKAFGYCIARTGLSEKTAKEKGYDVVTTLTAGPDREHFMPNVKTQMLKLIIDKNTEKILGAQSIGDGDCFSKIDIISTIITAGLTINKLSNLDLCYAPSCSLAIDNLITAINVARNKIEGIFEGISPLEIYSKIKENKNIILLDVRSRKEFEEERIPSSVLIPLNVLRGRLHELNKNSEIITFCSISLRGYEAALILKAEGFKNVKVLDGGLTLWPFEKLKGI